MIRCVVLCILGAVLVALVVLPGAYATDIPGQFATRTASHFTWEEYWPSARAGLLKHPDLEILHEGPDIFVIKNFASRETTEDVSSVFNHELGVANAPAEWCFDIHGCFNKQGFFDRPNDFVRDLDLVRLQKLNLPRTRVKTHEDSVKCVQGDFSPIESTISKLPLSNKLSLSPGERGELDLISKRLHEELGLPEKYGQFHQLVQMNPGSMFSPSEDCTTPNPRLVTTMLFLEDSSKKHTGLFFSGIDVHYVPVRGDLLIWNNHGPTSDACYPVTLTVSQPDKNAVGQRLQYYQRWYYESSPFSMTLSPIMGDRVMCTSPLTCRAYSGTRSSGNADRYVHAARTQDNLDVDDLVWRAFMHSPTHYGAILVGAQYNSHFQNSPEHMNKAREYMGMLLDLCPGCCQPWKPGVYDLSPQGALLTKLCNALVHPVVTEPWPVSKPVKAANTIETHSVDLSNTGSPLEKGAEGSTEDIIADIETFFGSTRR